MLLFLVRRHPASKRLRETNDIAGFYITILGGLYGVFIGFMVLVVWTRFDQAETTIEQEVTAITSMYLMAGELPDANRIAIRTEIEQYNRIVVNDEWTVMAKGTYHSEEAFRKTIHLWQDIGKIEPRTARDQVIMDQILTKMGQVNESRQLRLLSNQKHLPAVFWIVLIGGAILTIGSTAFFGVEKFPFHALKTSLLTILICLTLYAIKEVDDPFHGAIQVSSEPFERSELFFAEIKAQEMGRPSPDHGQ